MPQDENDFGVFADLVPQAQPVQEGAFDDLALEGIHQKRDAAAEASNKALAKSKMFAVLENTARVGDIFGAIETAARGVGSVLNAAGEETGKIAEDVIAGDIKPGPSTFLPRFMGGQNPARATPAGPVEKGFVGMAKMAPVMAAQAGITAATGIPGPYVFGSLMGSQTYAEGATVPEAVQAGLIGAAIPMAGGLGKEAAAKLLNKAVDAGLLSAKRTVVQKAVESIASQGGMQALMMGVDLPHYATLPPDERRKLIVENLIANSMWFAVDVPHLLPGRASETQRTMSPMTRAADALREATGNSHFLDAVQSYADDRAKQLGDVAPAWRALGASEREMNRGTLTRRRPTNEDPQIGVPENLRLPPNYVQPQDRSGLFTDGQTTEDTPAPTQPYVAPDETGLGQVPKYHGKVFLGGFPYEKRGAIWYKLGQNNIAQPIVRDSLRQVALISTLEKKLAGEPTTESELQNAIQQPNDQGSEIPRVATRADVPPDAATAGQGGGTGADGGGGSGPEAQNPAEAVLSPKSLKEAVDIFTEADPEGLPNIFPAYKTKSGDQIQIGGGGHEPRVKENEARYFDDAGFWFPFDGGEMKSTILDSNEKTEGLVDSKDHGKTGLFISIRELDAAGGDYKKALQSKLKEPAPPAAPAETTDQQNARKVRERVADGLKPEHVQIRIQADQTDNGKTIPGTGFVQIDEMHPTLGNTFSVGPEAANKNGLKVPTRAELMKLPQGQYTLPEAIQELKDLSKPKPKIRLVAPKVAPKPAIKPPKRLFRGVTDEGGGYGTFALGKGIYSSRDKTFAKKYGSKVVEVSPDVAWPKKPLVLSNAAGGAPSAFMDWALKISGLKNAREFNAKYPDPGVFVREQGFDGVIAGDEVVRYPEQVSTKAQVEVAPSGMTGEDFELRPELTKPYRSVAMKQGDVVHEGKPGDNHASIAERLGFPKDLVPGFVRKDGRFAYQYAEDSPNPKSEVAEPPPTPPETKPETGTPPPPKKPTTTSAPVEGALPPKYVQESITKALKAIDVINANTKKHTLESSLATLRTHASKLGIEVGSVGTYYNVDTYRQVAGDAMVAIGKKYGSHPTAEMRSKRDAVTPVKKRMSRGLPNPPTAPASGLTPMMAQYQRIKSELSKTNPKALLAFRLGDFYEFFFDDAKTAAENLKIALTKRNEVAMAGVPFQAAHGYFERLTKAGFEVAIVDTEAAPEPGKLAERKVTDILKPEASAPVGDVASIDALVAEHDADQGGRQSPDKMRLRGQIGMAIEPGLRLGDAQTVGESYILYKRGEMTLDEFNQVLTDHQRQLGLPEKGIVRVEPKAENVESLLSANIPDATEARARVKAIDRSQAEMRDEYRKLQDQIKEIEKVIKPQRGRPYQRSQIKASAKKSDVAKFRDLQQQAAKLDQRIGALDDAAKVDRHLIDSEVDSKVITDKTQPLLRRLDRAFRRAQDGTNKPEQAALKQALDKETQRVILEKYPDAAPDEIARLAPEVQRASYFSADPWKQSDIPTLPNLRRAALEAALDANVPKHLFPPELTDKLNRFSAKDRSFGNKDPVEDLSSAQLSELKQEILDTTEQIRKDLKAAEERSAAEKLAENAKAAKLLDEAQGIADSAAKTGTPGGMSPKTVKTELVARVKTAIDEVLSTAGVTVKQTDPDNPNFYVASSTTSDVVAYGEIEPSKKKFKVKAWRVSDKDNPITVTMPTKEEAEWVLKAMAAEGKGSAVIGIPGDGVFRLWKSGQSLLKVWKGARGLDTSEGEGVSVKKEGGGEAPPESIKTNGDWTDAKAYHGLELLDKISTWSPALKALAEKVNPENPEGVTTHDVDNFIEKKKAKPAEPKPEPPRDQPPGAQFSQGQEGRTNERTKFTNAGVSPEVEASLRPVANTLADKFPGRISAERLRVVEPDVSDPGNRVLNGMGATARQAIERTFGRRIIFLDVGVSPSFNGVTFKGFPGSIFVNVRSQKPYLVVVGHEMLHHLRNSQPEIYNDLIKALEPLMTGVAEYRDRLNDWRKKYGHSPMTDAEAVSEIAGDFVGDSFSDPKFWDKMAAKDPGLFTRVARAVLRFLSDTIEKLGGYGFITDIDKAHGIVADAMTKFAKARGEEPPPETERPVGTSIEQTGRTKPISFKDVIPGANGGPAGSNIRSVGTKIGDVETSIGEEGTNEPHYKTEREAGDIKEDLRRSGKVLWTTADEINGLLAGASRADSGGAERAASPRPIHLTVEGGRQSDFQKAVFILERGPEGDSLERQSNLLAHRVIYGTARPEVGSLAGQIVQSDGVVALARKLAGLKFIVRDLGEKSGIMKYDRLKGNDYVSVDANSLLAAKFSDPETRARWDAVLMEEMIHAVTFRTTKESELSEVWRSLSSDERQRTKRLYRGSKELLDYQWAAEYVRAIIQDRLTGNVSEGFRETISEKAKAILRGVLDFLKSAFGKKPTDNIARQIVERIEGAIRGDKIPDKPIDWGESVGTGIREAGDEPNRRHGQIAGVRDVGALKEVENIERITKAIRGQYFDHRGEISPEKTEDAWQLATRLTDPATKGRASGEVMDAGGGEMAPGLLRNELWYYALKQSSQGDSSLLRFMYDRNEDFGTFGAGHGGDPEAARVLRAAKERADSGAGLFLALAEYARDRARTAGKTLKGRELFDEIERELTNLKLTPEEVDAQIRDARDRAGKTLDDYLEPPPVEGEEGTARDKEIKRREDRQQTANAERYAQKVLDRMEGRDVEWLKKDKDPNLVAEIIKDELMSDADWYEKYPPPAKRPALPGFPENYGGESTRRPEDYYLSLRDKFVEAGVEEGTALRLAREVYNEIEARLANKRQRQMERAAASRKISALIEDTLNTPYRAQQDPAWRLKTAEDWFLSAGLSRDQATAAAKLFSKQFDAALQAAAEKAARRLMEGKVEAHTINDVIKSIRLGLTDPSRHWSDEIAERTGFRPLSAEQHAQLAEYELAASDPVLSPQEKAAYVEKMIGIFRHSGSKDGLLLKVIAESFTSSLLSGVRTATIQFEPVMMALRDFPLAVMQDPRNGLNLAKAMVTAYKEVFRSEFQFAWQHEAYGFHLKEPDRHTDQLKRVWEEAERAYKTGNLRQKAMARAKQLYAMQHFVGRFLNTIDQTMMATTREWKLAYYASSAFKEAGLSTKRIDELVDVVARARQASFERGLEAGLDVNRARVRANWEVGEAVRAFVANETGSDSLANRVLKSTENDIYSTVGRKASGITESDEGLISRGFMNPLMEWVSSMRSKGGLNSIISTALFGFVNIPYRTARYWAQYSPYGLLRYGIHKYRTERQMETLWKQSFGTDLQARARLWEAIGGTVAFGLATAWGLTHSTADDDADKKKFGIYITGQGPTGKVLRDAWIKQHWQPYAMNFVIGGHKAAIPLTRVGEAIMFPFILAAAADDAQWRKKEIIASGRPAPGALGNYLNSAIGEVFSMTGQRGIFQGMGQMAETMRGGGGVLKQAAKTAATVASAIAVPFKQLLAGFSDMFVGPLDQSSASAIIAANFPIVGLPFQQKAVNRFGDDLYDRSWYGRIARTGVPFVFQVGKTPENEKFYGTLVSKGAAAPELHRSTLEEKYGPLTNEQFAKFAKISGQTLKAEVQGNLPEIQGMEPHDAKKFLARAATTANREAASALGLESVKPARAAAAPAQAMPSTSVSIAAPRAPSAAPATRTASTGAPARRIRLSVGGSSRSRGVRPVSMGRSRRVVTGRLSKRSRSGRKIRLASFGKRRKIRLSLFA